MSDDPQKPEEQKIKSDELSKSEISLNKKEKKEGEEELEVEEMVKGMPPEMKRVFKSVFMSSKSGFSNPIYEKINEKHIEKIIDYARDDEKDENKIRSSNRYFYLIYSFLGIGFLVFLFTFLLPSNLELLTNILKLLVIFAAGVGGGFGLKSHLDKKNR